MSTPTGSRDPRHALVARALPVSVRRFLHTESGGGIALVVAATAAVVWANSPWRESYDTVWHTTVVLKVGSFGIEDDLRHLINDGLMTLFFVVVALEIKRELVTGDLRDRRAAALPILAAVGGMLVPAALYLSVNPTGDTSRGWGIPMATDIAFALGVLALLGPRVPSALKLFVLSLAIVDDVGAIVVIALFYSAQIHLVALGLAIATIAAAAILRRLRVWWPPAFITLGTLCWLATYESGVHPTLAGVAFGLLAPARPLAPAEVARRWAYDLSDDPSAGELRSMTTIANETVSVAERVQHVLHPITSFAVVPVFALANAGVRIDSSAFDTAGSRSVAAGIGLGLVVGKTLGISGASALAVRVGLAKLPDDTSWSQLTGAAAVAGIGFTVSLFVTGLAFDQPELQNAARLAVLVSSVAAAAVGTTILLRRRP